MRPEAPSPFPNMRQSTRPGAAQTSRPLREGQAQLCIRAKIDGRWKMVSAMAPDRTLLPQGVGWYKGQRVKADGRYYIRVVVNGRNRWLSAGEFRDEALVRRESVKQAVASGGDRSCVALSGSRVIAPPHAAALPIGGCGPVRLRDVAARSVPEIGRKISEFLAAKEDPRRAGRAPRTVRKYEVELCRFAQWCAAVGAGRLEDVTRQHLLDYAEFRERRGAKSNVSRRNILITITGWMRWHRVPNPLFTDDLPRIEQPTPEEYSDEEVDVLLANAKDETERTAWQFLLMTGARENECVRLEWGDLDLDRGTLTFQPHAAGIVRGVDRREHRIKDRERRELPLHPDLAQALLRHKLRSEHAGAKDLVFPGRGDRVQGHLLRDLKACAKRAGLDPGRARLHKFRSTFCSRLVLRTDIDIPTILQWMGHSGTSVMLKHYLAKRDAASQRSKTVIARAFARTDAQATA
ncbi:MAG: tyrosine-type recombinase/integrase [Terriglobales bacterium]